VILFIVAGMAMHHFWGQQWAPPVAILLGLFVAPMIPVPAKRD